MAAILGLAADEVAAACREAAGAEVVSPANLNGGGQVVIAGHKGAAMHVACHTIRHAVGTRLLRNGADLATIQHFLGRHRNYLPMLLYKRRSFSSLFRVTLIEGLLFILSPDILIKSAYCSIALGNSPVTRW